MAAGAEVVAGAAAGDGVFHGGPFRRGKTFDNLSANLDALRRGTVTSLIAQHPEEQVRLAVDTLAEFILRKKSPLRKDNYMHMDILTRYNVEDY